METIIDLTVPDLVVMQGLGLGMMLWMTHFPGLLIPRCKAFSEYQSVLVQVLL